MREKDISLSSSGVPGLYHLAEGALEAMKSKLDREVAAREAGAISGGGLIPYFFKGVRTRACVCVWKSP